MRQYSDETGNVKYHQILLPQHPLQELLQSLHRTGQKHTGISKMLQGIRQRYYYPNMAKTCYKVGRRVRTMRKGQTSPQCNDHGRTTKLAGMGPWTRRRNADQFTTELSPR